MIFEDINNENVQLHSNIQPLQSNNLVKNVLKELSIEIDSETLSKPVLQLFEKLIQEVL